MFTDGFDTQKLNKERNILEAEIRALYAEFDRRFHLNSAALEIRFDFAEDALGAYVAESAETNEHFHFSLPFIAYSSRHQLPKSDREDLYKHEYAHYMNHYLDIPKEYTWQPGVHGSAWAYCCSLIGAVPSPYYKIGESLKKQDYDKVIEKKKVNYKLDMLLDQYHREQNYQKRKNSTVQFEIGDAVQHPKFGEGTIREIIPKEASVQLKIEFANGIRTIDQKWLIRSQYH